jgi:thiosulfate/3-mercaptopyruvate sulfurtransferase
MTTFVSADWVAERIGNPEYLVIDTRYSMRHLMGHLKSAVNAPPPKLGDSQGSLLSPDGFAELFGAAGLGDDVTPVLYDGYDGRNSAMVAWILEYLGRHDVYIMDIVYDEWKSQGREVLYRPVPRTSREFTPRINPAVRASLDDVSNATGIKLVDTRTLDEYNGQSEADDKPGHIPGAVSVVWQDLVGEDGNLVCTDEKARQIFEAANISPSNSVVAYCKIGARAAVGYQAFKRLGYDVRLFDGSYAEWEKSGLPVEI